MLTEFLAITNAKDASILAAQVIIFLVAAGTTFPQMQQMA
jgi:hypothetical protein